MGILSQGSFLGDCATRLYRALDLDGQVKVAVEDTIQPVVVVGDGLAPGMGDQQFRRFILWLPIVAASNAFQVNADSPGVIIDDIVVGGSVAVVVVNWRVHAGLAAFGGNNQGNIIERIASTGEAPPLKTSAAGGLGVQCGRFSAPLGTAVVPVSTYVAPGGGFDFSCAGTVDLIIRGRLFAA